MQNDISQHSQLTRWLMIMCAAVAFAFFAGYSVASTKNTNDVTYQGTVADASGTVIGVGSLPPKDIRTPVDFKEFWDLWRQLKQRYHTQPVSDQALFYGAMSGMAASLGDPYTVFFEPKSAADFSDALQGKFEGIGAEIGIKDEQLQVIAPLPNSPADKAGLMAGDAILEIDKRDTNNMSVDRAVSLIRGPKGTVVTLTIGRMTKEKDAKGKDKPSATTKQIPITRDTIVVKSTNVKYVRDGVAVIEINHFNADTSDLFAQAVTEVLSKDPKGIVLDMRNDPGGYLDKAIDVASAWVGERVVVQEKQQGKITGQYDGTSVARLKGIPTVVLVNGGSASAAEIVAGALQDYGVAKLVGTKTFGKGSVQDYSEFPDKSSIKITIAEWLTPKGRSINKIGITPDVTVDKTEADYNDNRDPQLDKALEILTGKSSPAAVSSTRP